MEEKRPGGHLMGMVLLVVGGAILLGMLGINVGAILGVAIPILLIVYGTKKMKRAETTLQKGIGISVLVFGILFLIGALPLFIGILFSIAIMYFGLKMLKRSHYPEMEPVPIIVSKPGLTTDFDEEWNKIMKDKYTT